MLEGSHVGAIRNTLGREACVTRLLVAKKQRRNAIHGHDTGQRHAVTRARRIDGFVLDGDMLGHALHHLSAIHFLRSFGDRHG